MNKKKPSKIVDAHFTEDGAVVLTFTRPHNARVGAVLNLDNGHHTVEKVKNKHILVARKWPWWRMYWIRVQIAWRALFKSGKTVKA